MGKGSHRRPTLVDEDTFAGRWEKAFGEGMEARSWVQDAYHYRLVCESCDAVFEGNINRLHCRLCQPEPPLCDGTVRDSVSDRHRTKYVTCRWDKTPHKPNLGCEDVEPWYG